MVVDVCFPPMLLVHVLVRDVHVIYGRMVVLVSVSGEQVPPVLSQVQVVRDVIVLVAMHQGLMLVMSLLPRHDLSPLPARRSTCLSAVYIDASARTNRIQPSAELTPRGRPPRFPCGDPPR